MLNNIWWLILGVLIGWVVGWLIEVFYWRWKRRQRYEVRIQELEGSLDACHRRVSDLRGEIERRDLTIADLERTLALRPEAPAVKVEAPGLEVEAPEVAVKAPTVEVAPPEVEMAAPGLEAELREAEARVDDLTRISGIGPRFAQILKAAGITSFAQLAEADESQLAGIIQAPDWRRVDYDAWIRQARELRNLPPAPAVVGDDLTRIEGIGPRYAGLLRDAGITTFVDLAASDEARLQAIIGAPAWRRVDYPMWIEQARLAAAGKEAELAELQDRLRRRERDNLTLVEGVGAKTAAALTAAGITSFADLAAADETRLAGIIENAGLPAGDYSAWIEEARLRAAGKRVPRQAAVIAAPVGIPAQNLTAIRGIGRVFEQKLYEAGIGTYAELAALNDAEIRAIIQPQPWQEFDYENWNEQARRLAEETGTVGAVWNGIIPDDLSKIKGIGEVFEQKLYHAGIVTFAELATKTVDELEAIIQPEEWQKFDFASWIAQARELSRR